MRFTTNKIDYSSRQRTFEKVWERIVGQAGKLRVYSSIRACDESDFGEDFRRLFADKLVFGTRGFGYWHWKPYLVKAALDTAAEGYIACLYERAPDWLTIKTFANLSPLLQRM